MLAVVLTVGFTASMAAPAAAEHNGGEDNGLADALEPDEDSLLGSALGLLGATDRVKYRLFGPEDTAEENRDAAIDAFNQHNASFVEYANDRDIHEGEVVQIDCVIEGETATGYIVSTYNDSQGNYTSAEAVTSTDRSVDHTVTLERNACDNAASEIEYFHDEFASQDRAPTRKYMSTMASKYAGNADEPFTGGS